MSDRQPVEQNPVEREAGRAADDAPRRLRLLPAPLLSGALWLLWLLLNQSVAPGTLLLGAVLAVVLPLITAGLRPTQPQARRPFVALRLIATVLGDTLRSAWHTLWIMLTRRADDIPSGFVRIPLDLRDPQALAVLAMILALAPGTAWAEVAPDRSMLLIHVLDVPDEAALTALVKTRYERPLMEIFE